MLEWLAHTPYAEWVNQSWGWPLALTVHAFGTATVVGVTLWMTKPTQYLADGMFEVKFILLLIAIVVTWQFHRSMVREAAAWQAKGGASPRGRRLAIAACLLWAAVTIAGRLTAYLGSLYPA